METGDSCRNSRKRGREEEGEDEYDDDYSGEPSEKRSSIESGDEILHETPIPELLVGLVIGRCGQEIGRISRQSGCRIQVSTEKKTLGWRMVEIRGSPQNVEVAKVLIAQVVSKTTRKPREITEIVEIPADKCGAIIGKGGEMMAKMKSFSGCHIQLIQESNEATSSKPLRIVGLPEQIEKAKKMVASVLATRRENLLPSYPANSHLTTRTVHLAVPRESVGAIMGVQGATIRRISHESDARIQFLSDDDAASPHRNLVVIGAEPAVRTAVEHINSIVSRESESKKEFMIFYMDVPASKCGLLIGPRGETIRRINAESRARCELSRVAAEHPNQKTFVIRGTETEIEHAKHLIRIQVGDIPPNTPFRASLTSAPLAPARNELLIPNLSETEHIWSPTPSAPAQNRHSWDTTASAHNYELRLKTLNQLLALTPARNELSVTAPFESEHSFSQGPSASVAQIEHRRAPELPAPAPAQDYAQQWLQYFINIGDTASADAVRDEIAKRNSNF